MSQPPPEASAAYIEGVPLRAGPLRLIFDHGDLRYLRLSGREVIRRIYAAVRDRNWGTVPGRIQNLRVNSKNDCFNISYESEHTDGEIAFVWNAEISGDSSGTIQFAFDGEARSTFVRNRIGLCVLHPLDCAGQRCKVQRAEGTQLETVLPRLVGTEQPGKDVYDLGIFSHEVEDEVWARLQFEGDLFEMEDQRNWMDASFKIYSTPLRLPFPVEIKTGTRIRQAVTLTIEGIDRAEPLVTIDEEPPVRVELDLASELPRPTLGLCVNSFREGYPSTTVERLKQLNLSHLRADLDLAGDWERALAHAQWEASALKLPLELALTIPPNSTAPNIAGLKKWAEANACLIKRWLIFAAGAESTTAETFELAKSELGKSGPVGVGTNGDFYELNQFRPPWEHAAFVAWSMNPQVHAFDDLSLAETPETVPAQVQSASAYFPGKPLVVSPVTLKPGFNAGATSPESTPHPHELPPRVDPRQRTLLGAAWTLAVLNQLSQSRADHVTLFETVGWLGVIERSEGAPNRALFPSLPGLPFPVYFVLRFFNEFPEAKIVPTKSSRPHDVTVLALRNGRRLRLICARLSTGGSFQLQLTGLPPGRAISRVSLNSANIELALSDSESFLRNRRAGGPHQLSPHEIVCIDLEL